MSEVDAVALALGLIRDGEPRAALRALDTMPEPRGDLVEAARALLGRSYGPEAATVLEAAAERRAAERRAAG